MTDRIHSFVVVLDENLREDDAEHVINALRMVKGVAGVEPQIAGGASLVEAMRFRSTARQVLHTELETALDRFWERMQ